MSPLSLPDSHVSAAAVKSAKYLIKKSQAAIEDPMIGLLNLRNTPQEGLTTSPVQRLFGRRTKTLIPCANCILTPAAAQIIHGERVRMEDKKAAVAERYTDRRKLPPLQVGDTVRMQPITRDKKEWQEATVSKTLKNRSYEVTTTTGRTYRRSRVFLRSSCPSTHDKQNAERVPGLLPLPMGLARSDQHDPDPDIRHLTPPSSPPDIPETDVSPAQQPAPTPGAQQIPPYTTNSRRTVKQRIILDL